MNSFLHQSCFNPQVKKRVLLAARGINALDQSAAYEAFLATQPYPYYHDTPLSGQKWGDVIKILGNATKHIKLVTQNVKEELKGCVHGSFIRMDTKVLVEKPNRDICSWSFVNIDGLDSSQSQQLHKELRKKNLICKEKKKWLVCWSEHPLLQQVVRAAAYKRDGKPARRRLIDCLLSFPTPKLNEKTAELVADFLIDKALLTAFVKIESDQFDWVCSLVRRALVGTRKWLDEVHKIAPVPPGLMPTAAPYRVKVVSPTTLKQHRDSYHNQRDEYLCSLPNNREWLSYRLEVVEEAEWCVRDLENWHGRSLDQIRLLGDIYRKHHLYDAYKSLKVECTERMPFDIVRRVDEVLPAFHLPPGDPDIHRQLESCQQMLFEIARYRPRQSLESSGQLRNYCTQLLIKLNSLVEQALDRAANRLVFWPNNESQGLQLKGGKSCLKSQFLGQMSKLKLIQTGSQKTDLSVHYPSVWKNLKAMQTYHYFQCDKGADSWREPLTALINTAKHGQALDISWTTAHGQAGLQITQVVDRWQRSSFADCFHPDDAANGKARLEASDAFFQHQGVKGFVRNDTMRSATDIVKIFSTKESDFVKSIRDPGSRIMMLLLHTDPTKWDSDPSLSVKWRDVLPRCEPALATAVPVIFPKKLGSRKRSELRACTVLKLFKKWVHMYCFATGSEASCERNRFLFLPFARRILKDSRQFVHACHTAFAETSSLFKALQLGVDITTFLHNNKMVLDRADMQGNTALHWACFYGNTQLVMALAKDTESFKRAHRPNHEGKTPRDLAVETGNQECVKLLTHVLKIV